MDQPTDTGAVSIAEAPVSITSQFKRGLVRTGRDRDFLYVAEGAKSFRGTAENLTWDRRRGALVSGEAPSGQDIFASYVSKIIPCNFPATQFLPSWNIKVDTGAGFRVYMRVYDQRETPSPWFFVGEGGVWRKHDDDITSHDDWGVVLIDYMDLNAPANAFQYKVEFIAPEASPDGAPLGAELHRFFVHYSGVARRRSTRNHTSQPEGIRVEVPYRSQLDVEREELRDIVCCPTCVAMVLESRGINVPTLAVCAAAYDERHDIYGIWPRASQAAFQHGVKAWVQRFRHMVDVRAFLSAGKPIIASIRVKKGELRGARYPESSGHLIVIKGFSPAGKVVVNDPYSAGPDGHEIEYELEDIEKCWLDCGGVAIILQ